mmetsp:Transcript_8458/g.28050  ORF Transcript_8458/g.28050 Transcript_8458/m.28050 type:complete len:237 (-) Transcript_8458:191-901(-)
MFEDVEVVLAEAHRKRARRLGEPLEQHLLLHLKFERLQSRGGDALVRLGRHLHAPRLARLLEPRRAVRERAKHVKLRLRRPHNPGAHRTRREPDPQLRAMPRLVRHVNGARPPLRAQREEARAVRVVDEVLLHPERAHDAASGEVPVPDRAQLRHAVLLRRRVHEPENLVEEVHHLERRHHVAHRAEPDDVGEDDGDVVVLADDDAGGGAERLGLGVPEQRARAHGVAQPRLGLSV